MAEPDSDREDSANDEDEDDEDGQTFVLDDDESDDRVIVGETRFTRDDFVNARRSLPGANAPLLLVPVAIAFILFNYFAIAARNDTVELLTAPVVFAAIFAFAMWKSRRSWADNAFSELHGGHDVTFRVDRSGLAVETSKRQAKVAWEVLHRALETKLAFLVYTSANTVEVVPKRAFVASDIETLARWFRMRIPARPAPRTFKHTLILWVALIFAFLLIWQFLNGDHSAR